MTAANALVNVRPVQITDAMLTSSDVVETDYTAYSTGTTYALGDRAIVTTGVHKIYESVAATNLNHAVTDPLWWVAVSPTNRWKCFDTSNSTQTAKANSAQYVLAPGQSISHVALLNSAGVTSMRVQGVSAGYGAVYDKTVYVALIMATSSWYDWFLAVRGSVSAVFLDDVPNYPDATFTIDFVGTASMAFGVLMLGQGRTMGQGIQVGAKVSIQDYSRKEVNAFGDSIFIVRAYAKRASFVMRLSEYEVDVVNDFLASVRATPCLWIGSSTYTCTFVFGSYESFETDIQYGDNSICSLNLLGLT